MTLCDIEHHLEITLQLLTITLGWIYAAPKNKVVRPHKDSSTIIDASDLLPLAIAVLVQTRTDGLGMSSNGRSSNMEA